MFEYETPTEEVEHAKLTAPATSKDEINLDLLFGGSENVALREKIEEKEKHRDILVHMVKRLTETLPPSKSNAKGTGEDAGAEINPDNVNHLHDLHSASAPSCLPENSDQSELLNPPSTQHIDWTQGLYTPKEERDVLAAKLRIVEKEREHYLRQYRSLMSHKHRERSKQSSDGVHEGKVSKEKGDVKLKRRKHKEKDRLDREVTDAFLKRLEFDLVIREKSDDQV
ncbi:hypothetical protein J3E74DRAFT_292605 [Bipolaris maydis]|nr:hypothetical protein J3E74DRAFT_292605 [Bipolaris maydis]